MSACPPYRPTIRISPRETPFVVLIRRKGRIAFSDLQKPCASAFGTQSSPNDEGCVAAYSVAISICGIFPGANHGVRDRFDQPGPVQWSRNTVRQIIGVGRYLG